MPDRLVDVPSDSLVSRVVQQVLADVQHGSLATSERLPSERVYAERLKVSRSTVTAAYAELEQRGILRRLQGKGAYLCALPDPTEAFSWSGKVSRHANSLDEPVLELLARRCAGDLRYPFSAGTPSLEIFPKEPYAELVARVLADDIPSALAVAPTEGQWRLREAIAAWTGSAPGNVLVTAGAQEGIDLLARCLIEPGEAVIVDSPTYPGAIQSFLSAGARLVPWATDWSLAQLEDLLLRYRPKLLFTMPTFHNPTGRVMSLKTRMGLLELAHRYRVPVVEDDVYSRTHFGPHPMPQSLYHLDRHSQVISISTFSKMLAPGLRIGWLVAPRYMIKQLALIKMRSNLFTGGFNQLVLAEFLSSGSMDRHLHRLRAHHSALCELAVAALQPAVEQGLLRFRQPAGGLYLWCKVLADVDVEWFYSILEANGVSVAPGTAFGPERGRRPSAHFRLCFTATDRPTLAQGVDVLCHTLEKLAFAPEPGHFGANSAFLAPLS